MYGIGKRKLSGGESASVERWTSEIKEETFTFKWTLKNFSAFQSEAKNVISPTFTGPKSSHTWHLQISPRNAIGGTEYFSIYLVLSSFRDGGKSASDELKVRFQFTVGDSNDAYVRSHSIGSSASPPHLFKLHGSTSWGYVKFITVADLVNPIRNLIQDNVLQIQCRVWITGELKHAIAVDMEEENLSSEKVKLKRLELLSQDLKSVMNSTAFADVSVSTRTNTFLVHKSVLAARSNVFHSMLSAGMAESIQNAIEITDFEDDVVKAMLEYMYTGEILQLAEKATELLQIAEKYELLGLKEDCEIAIAANLTIENAAVVLTLSELYNAASLKRKVTGFINRNKEAVSKTNAFKQIVQTKPYMLVDLYVSQK